MKLLITGAKGQLGQETAKILNEGSAKIGKISAEYSDCKLTCMDIDDINLADFDAVRRTIKDFDIIINCAAATNVDGCETDRVMAVAGNVTIAENLAVAANEIGARLVQVSTDYVFDGSSRTPYTESDSCNPQSVYGETKRSGELAVMKNTKKYFIVRTAWLYGEYGKNFVRTIAGLARKNGTVTVVNDQFGTPTYANDLAYHLLKLALTDNYGIYHCTGNGSICSWYDFACSIVEYAGIDAKIIPCTSAEFPSKVKRPSYSVLDNAALRQTVGDEMRDWRVALKEFCERVLWTEDK